MHVLIMQQADCQLGHHHLLTLPKPPNTGIKDRLQIHLPTNASQCSGGIANLHHAFQIQNPLHVAASEFWRQAMSVHVGCFLQEDM